MSTNALHQILALKTMINILAKSVHLFLIHIIFHLGIDKLFKAYPNIRLLTTEVRDDVPLHFGDKYFGTE